MLIYRHVPMRCLPFAMSRLYATATKEASLDIAWSRLMYVVTEDNKQDVVEPMLVVSLTERRLVDGE
jgi:hypothetical protein